MSDEKPQYRDNETGELVKPENAETLAALEAEGKTPEGVYRVKFDDEGKEIPKEKEDEEKEKSKKKEGDEDEEDEDKDDKEEDEKDKDKKPKRKENFVFARTHKKVVVANETLSKENQELKEQIEKGIKKSTNDGVVDDKVLDEELDKLAEKAGLDPDTIKGIGKALAKSFQGQIGGKLKKVDELAESQAKVNEGLEFESDFAKTISKFSPEQKEHLKANKENIKQQAYTEEYGGTPIRTIIIEYLHDNPLPVKKKGAEDTKSKGGISKDSKNFEDVTDEDLKNMSQDEADDYFDWQDKQKGKNK